MLGPPVTLFTTVPGGRCRRPERLFATAKLLVKVAVRLKLTPGETEPAPTELVSVVDTSFSPATVAAREAILDTLALLLVGSESAGVLLTVAVEPNGVPAGLLLA